jgi:hypothetical protein
MNLGSTHAGHVSVSVSSSTIRPSPACYLIGARFAHLI